MDAQDFRTYEESKERPRKQNCFCGLDTSLNEAISCDTIPLKSGASFYNQLNCDSSWITLRLRDGSEIILFSLNSSMLDLTGRLSRWIAQDYDDFVLIVGKESSGMPSTLGHELWDKQNGELVKEFSNVVYHAQDSVRDFIVYLRESDTERLTLCKLPGGKEFAIQLPQSLAGTIQHIPYITMAFSDPTIKGQTYTFEYSVIDDKWESETKAFVSFDVSKLGD